MKLEDVGTRFKHYEELLNMWEDGLAILENNELERSWTPESDKERKKKLTNAIELLRNQLDVLSNYEYDKWDMRFIINEIPRNADDVKDD